MVHTMIPWPLTWAEDRATQRCDPSADPGAKTEERAVCSAIVAAARPSTLRDWHQSDKPSRHDAAISPAGCLPRPANTEPQEFQFTLNQDKSMLEVFANGRQCVTQMIYPTLKDAIYVEVFVLIPLELEFSVV